MLTTAQNISHFYTHDDENHSSEEKTKRTHVNKSKTLIDAILPRSTQL